MNKNSKIDQTDNSSLINIIKRQTDYDDTTIEEKLKLHNNNIIEIILEYNNIEKQEKQESNLSTNQKIFKAIRENF